MGTKPEVTSQIPVIPISGWKGDNLLKPTENMPWWKGVDVKVGDKTVHVHTLHDALNDMVSIPARPVDAPFRMPVSANMKNLNKDNMPKKGDIMVFKNDETVIPAKRIYAMVQTLVLPGPLSVGYSPTCYIRTAHSAMRIAEILKVRSKETGNQWSTEVKQLTSNCAAEVVLV